MPFSSYGLLTILVQIEMFCVTIWEMFHGRISLNLVLLRLLLNFVSGSSLELIYIYLKYQVKPFSSPWFWAACAAVIARGNHFYLKWSLDRLVIIVNGFLKLPNLLMLIKQKSLLLLRNLALGTFGELLIVFLTKVNLLYLLYLTALKYCLLLLIKQNCFLKTFLRTLILMTQVSFHLLSLLVLIWNYILFL